MTSNINDCLKMRLWQNFREDLIGSYYAKLAADKQTNQTDKRRGENITDSTIQAGRAVKI